ncbi:HAD family hydrolase [Streptomyces sp. NPDC005576]|uniref:HAD family hydrolase n=1 Tax=unclassified Streptomyces TaxID=2593676 RepID=UPI0034041262
MTIKGVLFDFSGTLFRIESVASWLRAVLDEQGAATEGESFDRYVTELTDAGALPGGPGPLRVPAALAGAYARRDESAELHRAAYTGLAREVELPGEGIYDALYARHMSPDAWLPYPDAADVLRGLRANGTAVGVVSNIGWDLRPIFRAHGLDEFVNTYVLSFEHGVQKPDARLFRTACERLSLRPEDVVMVGDDRHADGGAAALGCGVRFVDHLPVTERPDGLRRLGLLKDACGGAM